jgi:hypothetical protein
VPQFKTSNCTLSIGMFRDTALLFVISNLYNPLPEQTDILSDQTIQVVPDSPFDTPGRSSGAETAVISLYRSLQLPFSKWGGGGVVGMRTGKWHNSAADHMF